MRLLDSISFWLSLLGWLLLGVFGTWKETAPFWLGAPLLWAAALCGVFTLHWGLRGRLSRGCVASVLVFTAYVMWRALTSDVAWLARQDIVFGATAFIGWVLTAARYERPQQRFALITVWSLLIVGNLAMGLYQQYVNPNANPLGFLGFRRDYQDAVFSGFFPSSNHLCGFLELAAFPVLGLAVFGKVHSFVRILCGLVFVAAIVAISQTTSRGGLAFGVGILIFGCIAGVLHIMRKKNRPAKWATTAWLFAVTAALCVLIGWVAWHKLESKFGEGQVFKNMNSRTELWGRAYEQWHEAPVFGTGARSFEYYESSYRDMTTPWITWSEVDIDAIWAHNDWLQLLADYGLVGLLLAAVVLGLHCWKALSFLLSDSHKSSRAGGGFFSDHRGPIVTGALCGMIAFSIHCVADFHMHIGINAVLAAAVLGLMANPGQPARYVEEAREFDGKPRQHAARIISTLAAAVPAGLLAWSFVPWAVSDFQYYRARGIYDRVIDDPADLILASGRFQHAVEADPDNFNAWMHWGYTETGAAELIPVLESQYLKKALDRFKTAYRLYPQKADISATIGTTLDRLRQHEEAESYFRSALEWGSGSRMVHWYYGMHCAALGRYEEALEHLEPVVNKHKYGGWKRESVQKLMDEIRRRIRERDSRKTPVPAIPAAPETSPPPAAGVPR